MKNLRYSVAVDLDGVQCDFSKRIREITGQNPESLPKAKLWSVVQTYNDDVAPFFETLDKMPDADVLWNFLINNFENIFILTATGSTPKDGAGQKINWVRKNRGNVHVKVVASGALKAMYANPNTILIDDTEKAINPWIKAGGIGILHKNALDTINQLNLILNKD